jgi:hypothetical protein
MLGVENDNDKFSTLKIVIIGYIEGVLFLSEGYYPIILCGV